MNALFWDARQIVKRLGLLALSTTGANRLTRYALRRNLLVLTYHRVIPRDCWRDEERPPDTVFADEFDQQAAFVARHFDVLGGDKLRGIVEGTSDIPRYSLVITFDDGYENNFSCALPILQRHGLSAVFFVTTDFVGKDQFLWFVRLDRLLSVAPSTVLLARLRELDPAILVSADTQIRPFFKGLPGMRQSELLQHLERQFARPAASEAEQTTYRMMSWDQVRSLAATGMTIGSHTANHQILAAVSHAEASAELLSSRKRIEQETGQACWCFAYPNGELRDFRPSDERAARDAGYSCAFTQVEGAIGKHSPRYALPRVPASSTGDLKLFEAYVSGFHQFVKALVR